MSFRIDERCISCGACCDQCPVGAIGDRGGIGYTIDESCCVDCGACVSVCPADAIKEYN